MAEQNIRSLFSLAEGKHAALEIFRDSSSSKYKENLAAAIATYEECRMLADRLSLFSPNETLEDIATGDLQYLQISYRLGELLLKVSDNDRKITLQKARVAFERYLSLLSHYVIFPPAEKKLYDTYIDNPTTFSTISTTNSEARRASKIANYNQEKELKRKAEFLAASPLYVDHDDAAVRDVLLATISLHTHTTFQCLEILNRELDILSLRPPTPPHASSFSTSDERERSGTHTDARNLNASNYSDRLDRPVAELLSGGGPVLDRAGKPLRPFTLLDKRQELTRGVFRSGHNLPTMTIDEYLEEERRRGGIIEGGGEEIPVEVDEDNYAKGDEETMKAREWDEFVEANPKGSGNTLNRG